MQCLYVTLYPGPDTLVNGQLLHVQADRWEVRASEALASFEAIPATFWLNPAPVNCHVRIVDSSEDPVTGEFRARFFALDMTPEDRQRAICALYGLDDDVRLRSVS
jgi:hypothetical protein